MPSFITPLSAVVREWQSSEVRILVYALIVAVASVTAVSFFIDRVERGMHRQSAELLAADLVVVSSVPLRKELLDRAAASNLQFARVIDFPSVVLRGDETQLVQVKAVESGYPLRGSLQIRDEDNRQAVSVMEIPAAGAVWVEPRLQQRMGLALQDRFALGDAGFSVAGIIEYEPDRGAELFRLAPRVMMNMADLPATGLVGNNSRVRYRLLLAGADDQIESYRAWLAKAGTPAEEIQTIEQSRPELRVALSRANRYLVLAALAAVMVCGAAIALACQYYAQRNARDSAVLRCLGATQQWIMRRYLLQLLFFSMIATLLGLLVGYFMQTVLVSLLSGWVDIDLPLPGVKPVLTGAVMGIVLMLGFAIPPVLRLKRVSPSRVLRKDIGNAPVPVWLTLVAAIITLAGVIILQADDYKLAGQFLLVSIAACAVFWLLAWLLLRAMALLFRQVGMLGRYGLSRLLTQSGRSATQIAALCVGITALLVLLVARVDLLNAWQGSLPPDTPNHFMVNVQEEEIPALNALFAQREIIQPEFYPVIKGRLVAINQQPVSVDSYDSPRARRLIERRFNLTRSNTMPADNRILEGTWYGDESAGTRAWSVESGIAKTLGINLGDSLTYSIEGQKVEARVTSLREVDWDSFNVNFFVMASPALLRSFPASYITSFYRRSESISSADAGDQTPLLTRIARQFPSITVINVEAILSQVRAVIQRASRAIEFVFLFTVAAGVLVMYAAMQAGMQERMREISILRVMGASTRQVLAAIFVELALLGALAGLIAALATSVLTWLLATRVFDLPWILNPWLWFWAIASACIGVCVFGFAGLRKVFILSPQRVLHSQ